MYVITATPLKRGFGKESISYFSAIKIEAGSIISVPLRKKEVLALVLGSTPALMQKAELRSTDFALRKIGEVKALPFLGEVWMRALGKFARFFAISEGQALRSLMPSVAVENIEAISKIKDVSANKKNHVQISLFHGSKEERISRYKLIIRSEFAKKNSVFLCIPENEQISEAEKIYRKGIEKYIFIFKSKMSKKEMLLSWEKALHSKHPVLIIGTPRWLFLPRNDLTTIILENEQSPAWKTISRPYIDYRKFGEYLGEELGYNTVFGDLSLSVERLWQKEKENPYEFKKINFHLQSTAETLMLEAGKHIISPEILNLVREAKEKNKNIFIYATRKGLSSMTVCRDCGREVLCNNCLSPVVLYKRDGENDRAENIFKCHQCGESRSAQEVCVYCGSWRLLPLGVGVEKVAEELQKALPSLNIFEINKDSTPSATKARAAAERFYKTPGAVLVGTEMALNFLNDKVDYAAVASIDSLFAIPDFHIREKIFHILLEIRSLANEKMIVQERNAEKETIELALSGNMMDFYKKEISERKELNYPPFSVFIKITCRGTKIFVKKEMSKLEKIFAKWNPTIFPSQYEKKGSQYAENAVIKVLNGDWPKDELLSRLYLLPPFFEVKIDPDNLL